MGMVQEHVYVQEVKVTGPRGQPWSAREREDDGSRVLNWVSGYIVVPTRRLRCMEAFSFWWRWLGLGG